MDIGELQNIGQNKEKLSDKLIRTLSLDADSDRLGYLTKHEVDILFRLGVVNSLYLNNRKEINEIIERYLNLSASKEAKLLDNFKEMFITKIETNPLNEGILK